MPKTDDRIFEYACHEGNHSMIGILRRAPGAPMRQRAEEAAEAKPARERTGETRMPTAADSSRASHDWSQRCWARPPWSALGPGLRRRLRRQARTRAPRTADGKAQSERHVAGHQHRQLGHPGSRGPPGPGARARRSFSVPPGLGVVDGNAIPYRPEALAKKKENADNWMTLDPEIKCYMPGIPRATYQGYPFQIVQTPTDRS